MRFEVFNYASLRGAKIDWDIDLEFDAALLEALRPQDPRSLRPGRIRRAFDLQSAHGRFRAPKHGLVFAFQDESAFLVQVDES